MLYKTNTITYKFKNRIIIQNKNETFKYFNHLIRNVMLKIMHTIGSKIGMS